MSVGRPVTFMAPFIGAPRRSGPTTQVEDAFTDANGTALTAHTIAPTNVPGGNWLAGTGTFQIQSNKATPNSDANDDMTWKETSISDFTLTCLITPQWAGGGNNVENPGIILRVTDTTHLWLLDPSAFVNIVTLYENAGGGYVSRASGANTFTAGVEVTLTAVASGATITASIGASQVLTYGSATSNQTATKHGLRLGKGGTASAATWDSFKVTT